MNKLKAWLIRKLGGCVEKPFEFNQATYTIGNVQKITFEIPLPSEGDDKRYLEHEDKRLLGEQFIDECFTRQRTYNPSLGADVMRYTVRVIKEEE